MEMIQLLVDAGASLQLKSRLSTYKLQQMIDAGVISLEARPRPTS